MKKRVLLFLLIIGLSIVIAMIFLFLNKSEVKGFPHFKQANLEVEGSMYCMENKEFSLPIVFVDEENLSEMASADNIKSIYLVDKNTKKISATKWQVQDGIKQKDYMMRSIDCYFIYDKSGKYNPTYVDIEFKDGKVERYNIGKIDIIVKTISEFQQNCAANWFEIEFIIPKANNNVMASGIILVLDSLGKEVVVEDIDLGLQDFGIDTENIIVLDGEYDINYINELRNKRDKSIKIFDSIQVVENIKSEFKPIHIEASDKLTKYTTLIIPLTVKEGISNADKVVCVNPTIKIIQDGKHQELYQLQPVVQLPRINKGFIPARLLREKGI